MSQHPTSPCLDFSLLSQLQTKPTPFSPGEAQFWTDPHIAQQMLAAHLDPNSDSASRRPETIQRSVDWIVDALRLSPGNEVLDLGCGPGLYAIRLAQKGLRVSGIDFSENSIRYAVKDARQHGLDITYRCQDYLQLQDEDRYDAVLLIYGDYCVPSPAQRTRLLANVYRALKPGGYFVLDVTTPRLHRREEPKKGWYVSQGGFWKPGPHLVLQQGFEYEGDLFLDQYIVLEPTGKISIYRDWFQDYSAETIRAEIEDHAFVVESLWSDLTGTPLQPDTDWIGIIARRE